MPLTPRPTIAIPTAASGGWQPSFGYVGGSAGGPTTQRLYLNPIAFGVPVSITSLRFTVTTAEAGAAGNVFLGLYRDDGSGGFPVLAGGPLSSGTVAIAASGNTTGNKVVTLATPLTLSGFYWTAFLWSVTSGTVTTALACTCITSSFSIWNTNSLTAGSTYKGHFADALTALPTTAITLSPNGGNTSPVVEARVA